MDKLSRLKLALMETDEQALLSDTQLLLLLQNNKRFEDAVYEGFLLKAQCDAVTLPDGSKVENNRNYWLTLAKNARPANTGTINRDDDIYPPCSYGRCRK